MRPTPLWRPLGNESVGLPLVPSGEVSLHHKSHSDKCLQLASLLVVLAERPRSEWALGSVLPARPGGCGGRREGCPGWWGPQWTETQGCGKGGGTDRTAIQAHIAIGPMQCGIRWERGGKLCWARSPDPPLPSDRCQLTYWRLGLLGEVPGKVLSRLGFGSRTEMLPPFVCYSPTAPTLCLLL